MNPIGSLGAFSWTPYKAWEPSGFLPACNSGDINPRQQKLRLGSQILFMQAATAGTMDAWHPV